MIFGRVDSDSAVKYKETVTLKCDVGFIVNGTTISEKNVTCGSDTLFSGLDSCVSKCPVYICSHIDFNYLFSPITKNAR